ncbi:MAG: hypothetical protein AOA65_1560 [Candidatus Bathyarchaeota archaeon BA1]|nr:MAG: hypothetical protein AOA65_1560 [Candidatus Bathyarchaeota archaeon BA1]
MTKIAVRAAEIYREIRSLLDEAKASGMSDYASYERLVATIDELAMALHRMLYIDKRLDPEEEKAVRDALSEIRI